MFGIHRVGWKFEDNPAHRTFVATRLVDLKAALHGQVRENTSELSLRLATWNIMHFSDGGGYDRTTESMLYIAEIIDHFDLVAVQEVNRDLRKLDELMRDYLGEEWDYLVTDATEGGPGNNERLAFLYRKSKVTFLKEVGEIVLPEGQEIAAPNAQNATRQIQFARTPFTVAFRAGWLKFKLCTVHIFYGEGGDNTPQMKQRRDEIEKLARFFADRQESERKAGVELAKAESWANPAEGGWDANVLLLGDFNIISPEHQTMQALISAGFQPATKATTTDLGNKHHYDQVVFRTAHPGFKAIASGAFNMFEHVYRDEDAGHYVDVAKVPRLLRDGTKARPRDKALVYFRNYYRKHQMSDHKLLWCEICVDYANAYLERVIAS